MPSFRRQATHSLLQDAHETARLGRHKHWTQPDLSRGVQRLRAKHTARRANVGSLLRREHVPMETHRSRPAQTTPVAVVAADAGHDQPPGLAGASSSETHQSCYVS
eukprot:6206813-Pleurochrysis_carterae.AAC.1